MLPRDFWANYSDGLTPVEFMSLFTTDDPRLSAAEYVARRSHLYGVVRRRTWKSSFTPELQHGRAEVAAGLAAHLENTRAEWESGLAEARAARAEALRIAAERAAEARAAQERAMQEQAMRQAAEEAAALEREAAAAADGGPEAGSAAPPEIASEADGSGSPEGA